MGSLRIITIALLGLTVFGCSSTLETGYKPRALNDSPTVRRGYYASPFTPEAKAPEMDKETELENRRPRQNY
jgi:hypothetical protein